MTIRYGFGTFLEGVFLSRPPGTPAAIQIALNNTMASLGFRIRRALDEGGHIVVKRFQ